MTTHNTEYEKNSTLKHDFDIEIGNLHKIQNKVFGSNNNYKNVKAGFLLFLFK